MYKQKATPAVRVDKPKWNQAPAPAEPQSVSAVGLSNEQLSHLYKLVASVMDSRIIASSASKSEPFQQGTGNTFTDLINVEQKSKICNRHFEHWWPNRL